MQAFLIDPYQQTIRAVEYNGELDDVYRLIDAQLFTVATFDPVTLDAVYVDDEGLFAEPEQLAFFVIAGYPQPLAGKGLVVGVDEEGETVAPQIGLERLRERVSWMRWDQAVLLVEMGAY